MVKSKDRTVFVCDSCGSDSPKWEGRCPACGEWNTLVEFKQDRQDGRANAWIGSSELAPQELSQVSGEDLPRLQTSSGETNRVLGGGIVPGSMVLIAGDPGIGKSTLLLRIAADIAEVGDCLYVSGEESTAQVKMRANRLGVSGERVFLLQATVLEEVMRRVESMQPALVMVDSIQTMHDDSLSSTAGTVAQIRECTRGLMEWAKSRNVPVLLTGHVTKGGDIAGPRVLEHMVDVVLYLEGDRLSSWRLLRSVKNRFGSTNEVGVFEMSEKGLNDVEDPSRAFLSERREGSVGSVIVCSLEGSRPLLAEVQALTNPSLLPAPRRVATGVDYNRLLLICAVLTRRAGVSLANQDVLVNVAGGLRIGEPAADLGVALAIVSSARNLPVRPQLAAIGEIGLSGEVRGVPHLHRRLAEVARLRLAQCLSPAVRDDGGSSPDGLSVKPVSTLAEALAASMPSRGRKPVEVEEVEERPNIGAARRR